MFHLTVLCKKVTFYTQIVTGFNESMQPQGPSVILTLVRCQLMHYIVSPPEGHGHLALASREVTNNWCQSVSEEMSPTEQGESKGEGRPPTLLPLPDGDECMKGYSITATSKQIANSDRCCVPRYRTRGTQSYMGHMCPRGLHACRQEDSQQL